ncbi:GntR family transcriptional regulator [Paenarthrobacter sp. NPDC092416]|uniref:GntR family transcriptional regulator n=1 Tax=Paenarthrobacter sp. NPDC092416 TaxID=3364386 RepID=UPI003827F049
MTSVSNWSQNEEALIECSPGNEVVILEQVSKRTAPDSVYDELRNAILRGNLTAGTQLREAHIAKDLGVSRAPVREALARLVDEGLAVSEPFRGSFVANVGKEEFDEISNVRLLVEPYCVELALQNLEKTGFESLESRIAMLRDAHQSDDELALVEAHLDFHRFFYEECGNKLLLQLWKGWENKLRLFFLEDHRRASIDLVNMHSDLWEALHAGSPERVASAVRRHVHGPDPAIIRKPVSDFVTEAVERLNPTQPTRA